MAPSPTWLTSLKSTQLKTLLTAAGLPSTGTKPVLTTRLLDSLPISKFHAPEPSSPTPSKHGKPHRILSIDMGIRNLAYCQLAVPSTEPGVKRKGLPVVEAWDRIAIAKPPTRPSSTDAKPSNAAPKETFSPSTYAPHAYTFLSALVLHASPRPPSDILIERQRFRSMGGSAVQEWTLRVNMFEAMLWAVLETLRAEGRWEGRVWGVEPGRVGGFWVGDGGEVKGKGEGGGEEEGTGGRKRRKKGDGARKVKQGKEDKIKLVRGWLQEGGVVRLEGGAKEMGEAYLKKGDGGRKRMGDGEKMGKLDDLADCMLQGMAWVKWEENRRRILQEGVGFLERLGATAK
ncbi:hypothetical protein MMC30_001576 [Trapelia coarctata]|nr:hypothetical protein [Trapelia coarctata]